MGEEEKEEMPDAFLFLLCAYFSGKDHKTDGNVKCLAEKSKPIPSPVNTLILCSAKNTWKPFSLVNETIKINELIW